MRFFTRDAPAASCGHRGCVRPAQERLLTAATVVTFVRTAVSFGVSLAAIVAIVEGSEHALAWLVVALIVYWIGDVADGALARLTDTETRVGAVLDIVADRVCAAGFYLGFVAYAPSMALPVGVFLFEFALVDTFVSLAFLAWPLTSPNYFDLVDRRIWRANWSKVGKAINSSAVAVLMLVTQSVWLSTAIAVALLAVKTYSLLRLTRIGLPLPAGCAADAVRADAAVPVDTEGPSQPPSQLPSPKTSTRPSAASQRRDEKRARM